MQSSTCYIRSSRCLFFFFFNDTATTEIYTLSLHDALPISVEPACQPSTLPMEEPDHAGSHSVKNGLKTLDRKSTRLNSSHSQISYAVFCLKKKSLVVGCAEGDRLVEQHYCDQVLQADVRHI